MKFNLALLGSIAAFCSVAQAKYQSDGWAPGKPTTVARAAARATGGWTPGQPQPHQHEHQVVADVSDATEEDAPASSPSSSSSSSSLVTKLLVSGLNKFGVNISLPEIEKDIWDERIPLIHDNNYQDIIVNEQFESDEEAAARTWVIVITSGKSSKNDAMSKFIDQMFDSAFNTSQIAGDLPNVRWGRIDYFNVTHLTTKWNVWQAPYILLLKDRGQTLRFYRPHAIRVREDAFLEYLRTEGYKTTPPWSGDYAPGGEREWVMEIFAKYMTIAYNLFVKIPNIFLYLISGGLGSLLLSFMHKPSAAQKAAAIKEAQEKAKKAEEDAKAAAAAAIAAESEKTKTPSKGKKQQQSARSLEKARATETVSESSPERGSPSKTRSSTRQRKGKKATQ